MTRIARVFTTFAITGFHRWPDAPYEVLYLRSEHRHKFNVRIEVVVDQLDRQIEFHMMKRAVRQALITSWDDNITDNGEYFFGTSSCELIANEILDAVQELYPDRVFYSVEVNEDGENGAIVEARA